MEKEKITFVHTDVFSRGAIIFVWCVWAIMLLIAFIFVFKYGRNIPLAEDWHLVAPLTGHEPNLGGWLWAQNNEHRIPLPKIMLLPLLKITHGDFRSGMVLNIASLGLLAALLIKAFYHIRGGRTRYTDAFFPILLLHFGNWENMFWSWEFTFILAIILFCFLLIIILRHTHPMQLRTAVAAALCTVSLPLCGANGLLYLLPVVAWLAYEAFLHFRAQKDVSSQHVGFVLSGGLGVALFIAVMYFVGYFRPPWNSPSPDIKATLITSAKFIALGFGPAASISWGFICLIALTLVAATFMLLLFVFFKRRGLDRNRAVGLLLFLGGMMIFALAMGYGRAASVPQYGLPLRYVLLSAPTLIICYSSWELYGVSILKRIVLWGLFLTLLLLLLPNTRRGFGWRNYYLGGTEAVLNDIRAGVPHTQLVERHQLFLLHWNKEMLYTRMQQLKDAGMGPFQYMKNDDSHLKKDTSAYR